MRLHRDVRTTSAQRLQVVVTARNNAGDADRDLAARRLASRAVAPTNTAEPSVSGHAARRRRADRRTAATGPARSPITFAYQWQRCATRRACADIAGATSRDLHADGRRRRHAAAGAASRRRTPPARDRRVGGRPAPVPADGRRATARRPRVIGTARVGETLAVDAGIVERHRAADVRLPVAALRRERCQLRRTSPARPSAMYVLTGADEGQHDPRRRDRDPGRAARRGRPSPPSDARPRPPAAPRDAPDRRPRPTITGTARAGSTLHGRARALDRHRPDRLHLPVAALRRRRHELRGHRRRERRCEYTPTNADVGHTLRIVADAGRNASAASSQASARRPRSSRPTGVRRRLRRPRPPGHPVAERRRTSTPTPTAPATPSRRAPAQRAGDLSSLPGSQLSSASCATLVGGGGFRRINFRPRARSGCACAPTPPSCRPRPVRVTVNAAQAARAARRALHARRPGGPRGRIALAVPRSRSPRPRCSRAGTRSSRALRPSRGRTRVAADDAAGRGVRDAVHRAPVPDDLRHAAAPARRQPRTAMSGGDVLAARRAITKRPGARQARPAASAS